MGWLPGFRSVARKQGLGVGLSYWGVGFLGSWVLGCLGVWFVRFWDVGF